MQRQGFFPSGAMDYFALQAANLLVGNPASAAGVEIALGNFELRIESDVMIAVCGAEVEVTVDGEPVALWESHPVSRGSEVKVGLAMGPGFRMYIAFSGGVAVPQLFGSRATYTMGALGGVEGRALKAGDRLPLGTATGDGARRRFKAQARPQYARDWEIEVVPGPQAAPDYLTDEDLDDFFAHNWLVDRNSDRTGIRLEVHRFKWARASGGVAGGHPSNILDNPYPVGAVNINGDLPVILGPDGPTAGGFIVAATVAQAAFWKIGQLRPVGDHLRFRPVTVEQAAELESDLRERLSERSLESI